MQGMQYLGVDRLICYWSLCFFAQLILWMCDVDKCCAELNSPSTYKSTSAIHWRSIERSKLSHSLKRPHIVNHQWIKGDLWCIQYMVCICSTCALHSSSF